jgi:hypothetical protein
MAELIARSPLAARRAGLAGAAFHAGGISVAERGGLSAWLVTSRAPFELPGAIAIGPCEHLLVDAPRPAPPSGSALVQDMAGALAFIEISGPGGIDLLGLSPVIRAPEGGTATRLADLRVIVAWRDSPEPRLCIAVDRFSADYLWTWLERRIGIGAAA